MKVIIKAREKDHIKKLEPYQPLLMRCMTRLSEHYAFELPAKIVLRKVWACENKSKGKVTKGIAVSNLKEGYSIGINMQTPIVLPELMAHEAAHVAEEIKYGGWGHSEKWEEMFEISKATLKV